MSEPPPLFLHCAAKLKVVAFLESADAIGTDGSRSWRLLRKNSVSINNGTDGEQLPCLPFDVCGYPPGDEHGKG